MFCVGFDGMNFAIQVEVKAILRIVLNHNFSMMCGGFFFFFNIVCLYMLSNICSH